MALSTHVTARFGTNGDFLRQLTNHDAEAAATVNTTRLGLACDAASAQFPIYAQVNYDDTNQQHVEVAVMGVIAFLRQWSTKQGSASGEVDAYRQALKDIARISARKRVDPQTTSVLTPSDPDTTAGNVRPRFDPEQFEDVRPNPPLGDSGRT